MRILSILLLLFHFQIGKAEITWHFKQLENNEGLSLVRSIYRDTEGFLWIGNDGFGLMRFDGYQTQRFYHDPKDSTSISSDRILNIFQDSKERLWFCTRNGLNLYNPKNETFKQFLPSKNNSTTISHHLVHCIYEDRSNRIWIGTGDGLNQYNENDESFIHYTLDQGLESTQNVHSITEDNSGNLWLGTNAKGLIRFNTSNKRSLYMPNPLQLNPNPISKLQMGLDGKIWISTLGEGIFSFNLMDQQYTSYPINRNNDGISGSMVTDIYEEDPRYIYFTVDQGGINQLDRTTLKFTYLDQSNTTETSSNGILCIYRDNENIIWVGTSRGGVNYYNPNTPNFKSYHKETNINNEYLSTPKSLIGNIVGCFHEDPTGRVWIGTDGNGISIFNRHNGTFQNYKHMASIKGSLPSNVIRSIVSDKNENIWLATWDYGIRKYIGGEFIGNEPQSNRIQLLSYKNCWTLFIDSQNRMWVSYEDGRILMYDNTNKTFHDLSFQNTSEYISSPYFYEDNKHNILFSDKTGVYRFDEQQYKMIRIINEPDVNSLATDFNGNYWIGTSKKGVIVYDSLYHFTQEFNIKTGLLDNYISAIMCSNDSNIWISTANGLYCFQQQKEKLFAYYKEDGIQGNQFFIQASMKSRNGELFFGGTEGFTYFDPKQIKINQDQPKVIINNIYLENKALSFKGENKILNAHPRFVNQIKIRKKHFVLSIGFNAITFNAPNKCKYKYRLKGFDSNWMETTANNRLAVFTNLDPGEYTFEVKATNRDGIWSDKITRLSITIPPPFYQKAWFIILFIVLGFISVRIYIYLREKRLIRDRKALREAVEQRTMIIEDQKEELQIQNEELQNHRHNLEHIVDERTIELKLAKEKAEEANKLKTTFLANMSHEIRTPMNAIVGFSTLISQPSISDEERNNFSNLIRTNIDNLLILIEDILDISKIEANQLQIIKHPFSLNKIILSLYQSFQAQNHTTDLSFELNNSIEQLNIVLNSDEHRIKQIISNFLSNALKFTDEGFIRLSTSINNKHLVISVEDSGLGLTKKQIDIIFTPFFKLPRDEKKLKRGVGLGLAISKHLTALLGYKIKVQSTTGKGSVFSLWIPLYEIHEQPST